jgi:hypothetical protein
MRHAIVSILLLTALAPLVPVASAHHCAEPAPDESGGLGAIVVPENDLGVGTLYPFVDLDSGVTVFMESGQEPGLQTESGPCRQANGNQGHYGADCELAHVGLDGSVATHEALCGIVLPALP